METLLEFSLTCSLQTFWSRFWATESFYISYLENQLEEKGVTVSGWERRQGQAKQLVRAVDMSHPIRVSFPGTPSHARCHRVQEVNLENGEHRLVINESTSFQDIPYSDYFTVETCWTVNQSRVLPPKETDPSYPQNLPDSPESPSSLASELSDLPRVDSRSSGWRCSVSVSLEVRFHKSTWLSGTISANSRAESREAMLKWADAARNLLETRSGLDSPTPPASPISSPPSTPDTSRDRDPCPRWFYPQTMPSAPLLSLPRRSRENLGSNGSLASRGSSSEKLGADMVAIDIRDTQGRTADLGARAGDMPGDGLGGAEGAVDIDDEGFKYYDVNDHYQDQDQDDLEAPLLDSSPGGHVAHGGQALADGTGGDDLMLLKQAAVVILQFLVWKLRSLSVRSLQPYFTPTPELILTRLRKSLIPSQDTDDLLSRPDFYCPVMLVLTMAQVLLWCIDITGAHHGHCRRETLLGTSIVVSVSAWLGSAVWYHLTSFILGSKLRFIQSLAVSGYGMFGWCLALFVCQIIVLLRKAGLPLAPGLPLVIFGVPSGIVMGLVFSQQTPVRLRGSMALWVWPKLICFLIVAVTHYELLRYMFVVIIPGEQQLCALWSALQPDDFAKFVTQKDLRHFAAVVKSKAGM